MFNKWRTAKRVFYLGLAVELFPITAYVIYDFSTPLPAPFNSNDYPFLARFWIRKALQWDSTEWQRLKDIEHARSVVISTNPSGHVSPQATHLLVYASLRKLSLHPTIPELLQIYHTLTKKPHVGEGMTEERARLEASFEVSKQLCQMYLEHGQVEGAREQAERCLEMMNKGAPYLTKRWSEHPLKHTFMDLVNGNDQEYQEPQEKNFTNNQ